MDNLQRGLQETDQLYRAALAENRGLRKRLKIEREVMRGLLKGIVDPQALDRLIAHLDLFVAKVEAAASDVGAQGKATGHPAYEDTVAALEKVAVSLERARHETPDVQDMAFANGATHLRMVAARLTKRVSPHPAADPETIALLEACQRYFDGLREGHVTAHTVRLFNDCTAALARATPQPAAAPAKVVVDPDLMRSVQCAWDAVRDVIMHRGYWDDAMTRRYLDEAAHALEIVTAQLQGHLPGLSAQPGLDPEDIGEISRIISILDSHVISADRIEKTEGVIGDAVTHLRAVLNKTRAPGVSSSDDLARTQQF